MPLEHALHVAQLRVQLRDGGDGVLRSDRGGQAKLVLMRWQMLSLQRLELGYQFGWGQPSPELSQSQST
jgi:hypothetical protein